MAENPHVEELIWIQEAIVRYRHSREWFNARIREGKLEKIGLPGDGRVYLRRDQLESLLQDKDKK